MLARLRSNPVADLLVKQRYRRKARREHLTMGRYSYHAPEVRVWPGDTARVHIGSFTTVAPDAVFLPGGMHRHDWVSHYGFRKRLGLPGADDEGIPWSRGDIVVGNDVYLTYDSKVLSGVTIGDGAVIGMSTVVTKDVRPYAVVVGNPGREVRRRFTDEQVEALLRIAWWNWPIEEVVEHVDRLSGGPVEEFIERFDPARARALAQ